MVTVICDCCGYVWNAPVPSQADFEEYAPKSIQDVVSRILDFMGFEVALAGNGVEALSLFLKNPFDLVLTDLEMPIMDGWSLTHCIKERSPNTPVVLMTGGDRETVRKKVGKGRQSKGRKLL